VLAGLEETFSRGAGLKSWVESANSPQTDFPIENLPYGVFERGVDAGGATAMNASIGVAIGDKILDLRACSAAGLLDDLSAETVLACASESLNALMALGPDHWAPLRRRITEILEAGSRDAQHLEALLVSRIGTVMRVPAIIGDYTDFFSSLYHATNVGRLFRPDDPLSPNYKHVPIGYHGRASSIVIGGTPIRRPPGQTKDPGSNTPRFGPSQALDYEMEVGAFVGPGNPLGEPIPIRQAKSHIFGLCLLNDWSARDIQAWESRPLGPFLSKSFATSISPWVVSMEALEPFRVPAFQRAEGDPAPLAYLSSPDDQQRGAINLTVEVYLASRKMREAGVDPLRLSRGNFRDQYWTVAQLLAHHTSNGCNLRPGDLFGSGTVSGPIDDARGCLLELTRRGAEPVRLPTGEERRFLEDGDQIILRGYCEREGAVRIGFGECAGTILGGGE
jgi:fumarylacetoacetase